MEQKSRFRKYSIPIIIYSFISYYFGAFLYNDCINTIMPYVEEANGWGSAEVSAISTIAGLIAVVAAFFSISAIMKFGVKVVHSVIMVIAGIFSIILGCATEFSIFSLGLAVAQICASVGLMLLPAFILANWFRKRRGTIMGIATIGAPLSSGTCTIILNILIGQGGLDFAFGVLGGIIIFVGILGLFVLVDRPEQVGLSVDGENVVHHNDEMSPLAQISVRELLSKPESWIHMITFGLIGLIMNGTMSQVIPRFVEVGFSYVTAIQFMSIGSLLGIPLSYLWGLLDDKIGTRVTCILFGASVGIGSAAFLFASVDNMVISIIAIITIGSIVGGMPNLIVTNLARLFGRNNYPAAARIMNVGVNTLRSLGYIAMGGLAAMTGSYDVSFILFIGLSILVCILFFFNKGCYDPEASKPQEIRNS